MRDEEGIKVKIVDADKILYGVMLDEYNKRGYLYMNTLFTHNVECKLDGWSINIPKERIRIY